MLNKLKTKRSEGFTIIEVLIVLAIAGLILMIVFLAVPALQRNSRNTQRKNDVQALLGAVSEFESNNDGKLPPVDASTPLAVGSDGSTYTLGGSSDAASTFKAGYYNTGKVYVEKYATGLTPDTDTVYVLEGASCDGNTPASASARSVAAFYKIEDANQCSSS